MRLWSVFFIGLLVLTSLAPHAMANEECPSEGCPPGGQGNGQGKNKTQEETDGNETEGNATADNASDDPPHPNGKGPKDQSSREAQIEKRKQEARDAWRQARAEAVERDDDPRADLLARLPEHLREHVGQLASSDTNVHGTFVLFRPDPQLGLLYDVQTSTGVLFEEIAAPVPFGSSASETLQGKTYRLAGDGWSLRVVDDSRVPMKFQTAGDPFLLTLPADASAAATAHGLQITYPTGADTALVGRLTGDVMLDASRPGAVLVTGEASYHISAERPLLPQVSNQVRPSLEAALDSGRLGAETTVLRAGEAETFVDTVFYEDMEVLLEESTVTEAAQSFAGYTITVDSDSHEGKTIAVTFERGLIDPSNLLFRYFNVETDQTVEGAIVQARDLSDVLDPHNDGTVAEYWLVEDADGIQVLVSIPNFSVHQIQLMGLVDVVLERPSLVVGTVGAVLLVAVAAGGVFRRPEDDA